MIVPKNYISVKIKPDTAEIIELCKEDFVKAHPEFKGKPITNNHIIFQMARFYLKY